MSGKRVKSVRRSVRRESNKIKMSFLNSIRYEPLTIRLKVAWKIIFKWNPKKKYQKQKEKSHEPST